VKLKSDVYVSGHLLGVCWIATKPCIIHFPDMAKLQSLWVNKWNKCKAAAVRFKVLLKHSYRGTKKNKQSFEQWLCNRRTRTCEHLPVTSLFMDIHRTCLCVCARACVYRLADVHI